MPTQVDWWQIKNVPPLGGGTFDNYPTPDGPFSGSPLLFDNNTGLFVVSGPRVQAALASLLQAGIIGTAGGQQLQGPFFLVGPGGGSSPPSWSPDYWALTLQNGNLAFYGDDEGPLTQPNAFINWNLPGGTPELQIGSSGNLTMQYAQGGAGDFNLLAETGNAFLQLTGSGDLFTFASGSHTLQSTEATVTFPQGILPGAPAFDFSSDSGDQPYYSLQDGLYQGIYATVFGGLSFAGGLFIDDSGSYAIPWSAITSTPTDLAGYGITDAIGTGTPLGGDLSGFLPDPTVTQIDGSPLSISSPALGDVLTWNGSAWIASPGGGTVAIGSPVLGSTDYELLAVDGMGNLAQVPGVGTLGQVLTSQGPGSLPTWGPVPVVGPAPNAPTGLSGSPGDMQVAWTWTAPSSGQAADSYTLQIATNNTFTAGVQSFPGLTGTSYTTTGLTNGTLYYAEVTAVHNSAAGPWSNVANSTPGTTFLPSSVPGLVDWLETAISGSLFQDTAETTPATTNGDPVQAWKNQATGGDYKWNSSDSANPPTLATNAWQSSNAVYFNGTNSAQQTLENLTHGFAGGPFTVFVVVQDLGSPNFPGLVSEFAGSSHNLLSLGADGSGPAHRVSISSVGTATSSDIWALAFQPPPRILCFQSSGVSGGNITVTTWKNGVQSDSTLTLSGLATNAQTILGGGVNSGPAGAWVGLMLAYLYYDNEVASGDIANLFTYLAGQYSLTVDNNPVSLSDGNYWDQLTNPQVILTHGSSGDFDYRMEEPTSLLIGGTYYVYYTAWTAFGGASVGSIGYASGASLTSLAKQGQIFTPSGGSNWDSNYVSGPRLLDDTVNGGSYYWLFYFGSQSTNFEGAPASIGAAYSTSLSSPTWTRSVNNPLLVPGTGSDWDAGILFRPFPFFKAGTYYLYYNAGNAGDARECIGVATASAPDGPYTKYSGNPILSPDTGSWDSQRVGDPYVWEPTPGVFVMLYYGGGTGTPGIGVATAPDPLGPWTKYPGNPVDIQSAYGLIRPDVVANGSNYAVLCDDAGTNIYSLDGRAI